MLDVVYNHLGPEGNYLGEFGPYFTDRYKTPWGTAINFDGPDSAGVRRHFVENARYWVREFHVDGLRLDAIHSIFDQSPVHILTELAEAAREEARLLERPVHIIAESHDNDRRIVLPASEGGIGLDAVWADDFHHAIHAGSPASAAATTSTSPTARDLARAMAEGFAYQGEPSRVLRPAAGHPERRSRRRAIRALSAESRPGGQSRAGATGCRPSCRWPRSRWPPRCCSPRRRCRCSSWARSTARPAPFQFFTSYLDPALVEAVRVGRAAEFSRFGWSTAPPDPGKSATFLRSRLNHSLAGAPRHRELREYYRHWLTLRRTHPALGARGKERARCEIDDSGSVLTLTREAPDGMRVCLVANLTNTARPFAPPSSEWRDLLNSEDPRFSGGGMGRPLAPYQAVLYEVSRRV